MPPPGSNAFDRHSQQPPGGQGPEMEDKRRTAENEVAELPHLFSGCAQEHIVCVRVCACVFGSLSDITIIV